MSNLDSNPHERVCENKTGLSNGVELHQCEAGVVEILESRAVPLGGPRAMTVQRALPQKARSLIGAWCFSDSFGPDNVAESGGMKVPRHPHTGLGTVSWLFEGTIDHIDSAGNWATVHPGWVNLMSAGTGITHSEFSSDHTTVLHGLQLWYAFPDQYRFTEPSLQSFKPETITGDGHSARVFLGSLLGQESPVSTFIPLTGAEFRLEPGASVEFEVPTDHEHGLIQVTGAVSLDDVEIPEHSIGFAPIGRSKLKISAGAEPVIAVLIGGEPLNEQILMWWNFVGRTHEEIKLWRSRYMQEMGFDPASDESPAPTGALISPQDAELLGEQYADGQIYPQYGEFPPHTPDALPAPALPNVELRPRPLPTV